MQRDPTERIGKQDLLSRTFAVILAATAAPSCGGGGGEEEPPAKKDAVETVEVMEISRGEGLGQDLKDIREVAREVGTDEKADLPGPELPEIELYEAIAPEQNDTPADEISNTVSAVIDPAVGGSVEAGNVALEIPPGATDEPLEIAVTALGQQALPGPLPEGYVALGAAALGPDGTQFHKLLALTMSFAEPWEQATPGPVFVWDAAKGAWAMATLVTNQLSAHLCAADGGTATALIDHFSIYVFAAPEDYFHKTLGGGEFALHVNAAAAAGTGWETPDELAEVLAPALESFAAFHAGTGFKKPAVPIPIYVDIGIEELTGAAGHVDPQGTLAFEVGLGEDELVLACANAYHRRIQQEYFDQYAVLSEGDGWWMVHGTAHAVETATTEAFAPAVVPPFYADTFQDLVATSNLDLRGTPEQPDRSAPYWYFMVHDMGEDGAGFLQTVYSSCQQGAPVWSAVQAALDEIVAEDVEDSFRRFSRANFFQAEYYAESFAAKVVHPFDLGSFPHQLDLAAAAEATLDPADQASPVFGRTMEPYGVEYFQVQFPGTREVELTYAGPDGLFYLEIYPGTQSGGLLLTDPLPAGFATTLGVEGAAGTLIVLGRFNGEGAGEYKLGLKLLPCASDPSCQAAGQKVCQGEGGFMECLELEPGCFVLGQYEPCAEAEPCTAHLCQEGLGCMPKPLDGEPCDDANACTVSDACLDGQCQGGEPADCDDKDACTADDCGPELGCTHSLVSCDDEDSCTEDSCSSESGCQHAAVDCNDQDACTDDGCDPASGCTHSPVSCADEDACTEDLCEPASGCLHPPTSCDDSDLCTTDSCPSPAGCLHETVDCDDQDACTTDSCAPELGCQHATVDCDDKDACTTDSCAPADGCQHGPVDCDDLDPCTDDSCAPATGCGHTHNAAPCDDGSVCTDQDLCLAGQCLGSIAIDCSDEVQCTVDSCDPTAGCAHANMEGMCDDFDVCTFDEWCQEGACAPKGTVECDDGNLCTDDPCDPLVGCLHLPNQVPCDDGNKCTQEDHCRSGVCRGIPVVCNDGKTCTTDSCDPTAGCSAKPNNLPCDDGNACSVGDDCAGGGCAAGVLAQCDDDNPCTDDSCDPASGCVNTFNQAPCDDGNACTAEDVCVEGFCGGGPAACDDQNSCTDDLCKPFLGCVHVPNSGTCNDGDPCTINEACKAGVCQGAAPVSCDDANACTKDSCDVATGACLHEPLDGTACDDGHPCTKADKCKAGHCVGGTWDSCDDVNPCTEDSCDPATGCVNKPNSLPCDDGSKCTLQDLCSNGQCLGTVALVCIDGKVCTDDTCDPAVGCVFKNNSAPCDDGSLCTAVDTCSGGVCKGSQPPDCADANLCTDDLCHPLSGCYHTNNSAPCDDGDPCTLEDKCSQAKCTSGKTKDCNDKNSCTDDVCNKITGECDYTNRNGLPCDDGNACKSNDLCFGPVCMGTVWVDCDDSNMCTEDTCEEATGCIHTPVFNLCNDANECTENDVCSNGICKGSGGPSCDDGKPCTKDTCTKLGGCAHTVITGACSDGNPCTTGDTCDGETCVGGPAPNCNDNNPCTADTCDPAVAGGCKHTPNTAACDDGNPCTSGDTCSGGTCKPGGIASCSDGNPCTDDPCLPAVGCKHLKREGSCDDSDPCSTDDFCMDGKCVPGKAVSCDDDDQCTDDSCEAGVGCLHSLSAGACEEGDLCSVQDTCVNGSCIPGKEADCDDDNPCTDDSCDPQVGCVNAANSLPCDDGDPCTTFDTCAQGVCYGGPAATCDDGNGCTDDACEPGSGCTHQANNAPCRDANLCTTGDTCAGGNCVGGPPPLCDDGNGCTDDACDPAEGCVHAPNDGPCSDGNACTTNDHCQGGGCAGGPPLQCDDGEPCTIDFCLPDGGCKHKNTYGPCDDGNLCTFTDTCMAGRCQGQDLVSCDDGNPCTDDSCDWQTGCQHSDNAVPCSDGSICTTGDHCDQGLCVAGALLACGDGNPCTDDSCDPIAGCLSQENSRPCSDGDACTTGDTCSDGLCEPGPLLVCDDSNGCTDDLCDAEVGCLFAANEAPCDDGLPCTAEDQCLAGVCAGAAVESCDDGNPCTDDSCDPLEGCQHEPLTGPCDDKNPCSKDDACVDGVCKGAGAPNCDDGNPCTNDFCSPGKGCYHTNLKIPCDDGNACTSNDVCGVDSQCKGKTTSCDDANPCSIDSCDPKTGCKHTPFQGLCTDGNACTLADSCVDGICTGQLAACNDLNPCTDDSCNPKAGCLYVYNTVPCSDSNLCTQSDACSKGQCVGKQTTACDDGNPCTNDWCNPKTGCEHAANTANCDDGNLCTSADKCGAGLCRGSAVSCDDGNVCTDDSCGPATGCVHSANDFWCDDGKACTTQDHCVEGACVGGEAPDCDDGNACTDDACDNGIGCKHTANAAPCDDGNPCTDKDVCMQGACTGITPVACDDENPCTHDSCEPWKGCVAVEHAEPCDDGNACTFSDLCSESACEGIDAPDGLPCDPLKGWVCWGGTCGK
jgi:hypothetical protein